MLPDAWKDWGQEKKMETEDEMVGWHHWLNEHKFEQTRRDGEGQGNLTCCNLWGHKESVMAEWATTIMLLSAYEFRIVIPSWRIMAPNGNPLQYSCLENPMDRGVWPATVNGDAKS